MVPDFRPPRWLRDPWAQTVASRFWPHHRGTALPTRRVDLRLPDGDVLALADSPARTPAPTGHGRQLPAGVAVLVHGLCGNQNSPYMRRVGMRLHQLGQHCVRVNLRGSGPGQGLARRPYHSGQSADIRAVLDWVAQRYPNLPITLVGFSLGANIVLDLVGEHGAARVDMTPGQAALERAIAISPPTDLSASADKIDGPGNTLVRRQFLWLLEQHVQALHRNFPDTQPPPRPARSLREFDDLYTAPRSGFRDAAHYYASASSLQWLAHIRIPTRILCALDDPVIDTEPLTRAHDNPALELRLPQHGGHVGFLGEFAETYGRWWVDQMIVAWMAGGPS